MKGGSVKGGTGAVARLLLEYYQGGRRVFGYGRWASARWAVRMVFKELVESRPR